MSCRSAHHQHYRDRQQHVKGRAAITALHYTLTHTLTHTYRARSPPGGSSARYNLDVDDHEVGKGECKNDVLYSYPGYYEFHLFC